MTGTSLFPSSFGINYEFIDTELGGEPYLGHKGEEVPVLCSRVFRKRKGEFQSPRNVFLHGRGGAKNISCLYRFEASVGERVGVWVDRKNAEGFDYKDVECYRFVLSCTTFHLGNPIPA